jgi:hypothetical protein
VNEPPASRDIERLGCGEKSAACAAAPAEKHRGVTTFFCCPLHRMADEACAACDADIHKKVGWLKKEKNQKTIPQRRAG